MEVTVAGIFVMIILFTAVILGTVGFYGSTVETYGVEAYDTGITGTATNSTFQNVSVAVRGIESQLVGSSISQSSTYGSNFNPLALITGSFDALKLVISVPGILVSIVGAVFSMVGFIVPYWFLALITAIIMAVGMLLLLDIFIKSGKMV